MKHSEQWNEVAAALAKAQLKYKPVPKNKTAKVKTKSGYEYTYQYADLADCLSMALPLLSAEGIAFLQPHTMIDGKLRVVTVLVHSSGQWMESDGIEISEEGDPQQFGAESTYFRRYDGCSFVGIAPDEDTDAQQAGPRTKRTTPAQAEAKSSHGPAHASQEPGMYDEPPTQTSTVSRSQFFGKAKEYGWPMDALKKLLMEAFKTFDTSKLSQKQLQNALHAMAAGGPDEVLANLDQYVF